mgnify:CR=1 FL=1
MKDKKELGQFFTNDIIAEFMVKWLIQNNPKNILDPAVGLGIFMEKVEKYKPEISKTAFDIDEKMIKIFKEKNNFKVNININDYLSSNVLNRFDAIVCNPPYNKFQKILNRKDLIKSFEIKYGIKMSGYSNLYVYFLVKSMNELSNNGRCCYIIPYEFLCTGYGENIKNYLITSKMLKAIIKFNNKTKLFADAITTSCILCLENKSHSDIEFINIEKISELQSLSFENNHLSTDGIIIKNNQLNPKDKWLKYFKPEPTITELGYLNLIKLNEIAQVKRGIATGNNAYFTFNQEKIKKFNLSSNVCLPCISKSSDIKKIFFDKNYFDELVKENKKMFLFDGNMAKIESDFTYIKYGESINCDKTYLTSHRNPWYSIEEKKSAPILLSVFSRNKNLKVIRNEMMIKNLTTFHGLFLKNEEGLNSDFINLLFCYLITPIAQEILYLNKREYGEGLDKFEPNDLNNSYILDLRVINNFDRDIILTIYEESRLKKSIEKINELNNIFIKYCKI